MHSELWQTTAQSIHDREHNDREEEKLLNRDPELRKAQRLMAEKARRLLLTIYAPGTFQSDRIACLFALNRIKLLGTTGRLFRRHLATLNKHYCYQDGTLKTYDQHIQFQKKAKRVRELVSFLKSISSSKDEFLKDLQRGIELGITACREYYDAAKNSEWQQKRENPALKFAQGMLTNLTGVDLIAWNNVEQSTVLSNKTNQDFMRIIHYCEHNQFWVAKELIERHRDTHNGTLCKPYQMISRYYNDVYQRTFKGSFASETLRT